MREICKHCRRDWYRCASEPCGSSERFQYKRQYPGRVRPRVEKPTLTDQRLKVGARFAPQPNGCIYWTGPMTSRGYPRIYWQGKSRNGYRYALLILFQGNPPPLGPRIAACPHDRRCCHPEHLTWKADPC